MRISKWLIFLIYMVGSNMFSMKLTKITEINFLPFFINGFIVLGLFMLYQRYFKTGSSLTIYILIIFAATRAIYVSWMLQYDKYNVVRNEAYLYLVTFVLISWCAFEIVQKKRSMLIDQN